MPGHVLDAADRRILENLQKDGRLTNLDLAEAVGLSPSPCLRRLRTLEADGFIEGYTARIDRQKIQLNVMAMVLVQLDRQGAVDVAALRSAVAKIPEVTACYLTAGEFDILLHVVAKDLDEYRDFALNRLSALPGLRATRTMFVIDTVCEHRPLPLKHIR